MEEKEHGDSRYTLRMPTALYEWIQQEANKQYRSSNSLIVSILQQAKEKKEKQ